MIANMTTRLKLGVGIVLVTAFSAAVFNYIARDTSVNVDDRVPLETRSFGKTPSEMQHPEIKVIESVSTSGASKRKKLLLAFPDGSEIAYSLRAYPPTLSASIVASEADYADLSEAARHGDADAAYDLYKALNYCEFSFRSASDLEKGIEELHRTGKVTLPPNEHPTTFHGNVDYHGFEHMLREQFSACERWLPEQMTTKDEWFQLAANAGNPHAAFELGQRLLNEGNPEAERYLKSAWAAGNLVAASHLWHYYTRNRNPELNEPVQGFAYGYLYGRVNDGFMQSLDPGNARDTMMADNARKLSQAGYELGPRDMDQAIELAKFLLAGNENCCFAPRFR